MYVRNYKDFTKQKDKQKAVNSMLEKHAKKKKAKELKKQQNRNKNEVQKILKDSGKQVKYKDIEQLCLDAKGLKYTEFLKSPYWKTVVKIVLKRDKKQCTVCKSKTNLNIHHTTYKHHYSEHKFINELLTLCKDCHHDYHMNFEVK